MSDQLKTIIDDIAGLPTLPSVITKVTKMLQNPKVSATEIGQAISSDQSLASKILKIVNSPFYGFPSRIKTITHAIVILGFNAVKATALSASVFSTLNKGKNTTNFNREEFWKHSLGVGAIAKVLAKRMQLKEVEEVFLAGLMHDLGKVILDQFLHDKFEVILEKVEKSNCLVRDAEKEVLEGVSHTEIGGWLAKKWHLNEELVAVIENHHNPSSATSHFQLTAIIHIANGLVRVINHGCSGDHLVSQINEPAWDLLKITDDNLQDLLKEIHLEIEKAEIFFNLVN